MARQRGMVYGKDLAGGGFEDPLTTDTNKKIDSGFAYLAVPLAWLIPGAGHLLIGEKARGILFMVTIHLLFAAGLFVAGIRAINPPEQAIWTYTQFLAGWPTLVTFRMEKGLEAEFEVYYHGPGDSERQSFAGGDYERAYPEHKRDDDLTVQSESVSPGGNPAQHEQDVKEAKERRQKAFAAFAAKNPNAVYSPKIQDIGAVYCGIAGMLNLLVVFDVWLRASGNSRHPAEDKKKNEAATARGGGAA